MGKSWMVVAAVVLSFLLAGMPVLGQGGGQASGSLNGTVRNSATGLPIGGALVNVTATSAQGNAYTALTNSSGAYMIYGITPANYDINVTKPGYLGNFTNNKPVNPNQNTEVNFLLSAAGGSWAGSSGNISGVARNISGSAVANAFVKVAGTGYNATTDALGQYLIADAPAGTYDLLASKPSDGYDTASLLNFEVLPGSVSADFTLLRSLGGCNNDCTLAGSNACSASCQGKGSCSFYSPQVMAACDGKFGIVELPGGNSVNCCTGIPFAPLKADVSVPCASNLVKAQKIVLYAGKLVNMNILLFNLGPSCSG